VHTQVGQSRDHASPDIPGLVRAARNGDAGAFRRLVELYMRAVYGLAYRMTGDPDDADDVAQETFVRAWRALDRYDETFSFYTWLRTIATRLVLQERAKRRRRRTESGETFDAAAVAVPAESTDPLDALAGEELQRQVSSALQELPEEFRAVLVLRAERDLSYDEIAEILALPAGTVMSRLHRARRLLRSAMGRSVPAVRRQGSEGR
jgi:RNA polymerase sigma-70 factor (ECF subfamily)